MKPIDYQLTKIDASGTSMCGRFTLTRAGEKELLELLVHFGVTDLSELKTIPRFNIAPSQTVLTIFQQATKITLTELGWGYIPNWAKDLKTLKPMINARIETIAEKAFFKSALKSRRCLIPADGFFEWKVDAATGQKTPTYIFPDSKRLFVFAGLWDQWLSPDGEIIRTCSIITMPSNSYMQAIHHRMPAILPLELGQSWLNSEVNDSVKAMSILRAAGDQPLDSHPVSRAVNSTKIDSSECIVEVFDSSLKLF